MLLILFQVVAVLVAAFLALCEIRSIVYTGPLLSLTAALLAFHSFRHDRVLGLYLGLATPAITVMCFALICGLGWNPHQARVPVMTILMGYTLLHLPVGVGAFEETGYAGAPPLRPVQFSLSRLMGWMLIVAILLGLYQGGEPGVVALGTLLVAGVALGRVLWRFHTARPVQPTAIPETPELLP